MGVYSKSQLYDVFGSLPQIIGDYQADNVHFAGSFPTLQDIDTYGVKSDNSNVLDIWREHFAVIVAANAVIQYVPGVDRKSPRLNSSHQCASRMPSSALSIQALT